MSRGLVEKKGLPQTTQYSDALDRRHGIWFDVFVDSVDIHERKSNTNLYGPVLFVFDAKFIEQVVPGRVCVTKLNPTKWDGNPPEEYWFSSADDLRAGFVRGRFDQMIVFRDCGEVPFNGHLKEIILDDPHLKTPMDGADLYDRALEAIQQSMTAGGMNVPIRKRACNEQCNCVDGYSANKGRTLELFSTKI
jgi:hypothetical protein